MRELIADHIKEAALHRTAPMIADADHPSQRADRLRKFSADVDAS